MDKFLHQKRSNQARKKKIILSVSCLVVLTLIGIVGISVYVGWSLTHPERKALVDEPSQYGLPFEEFAVQSGTGKNEVELSGWFIRTDRMDQAKGNVIFAHGYRNNRLQGALPALALAQNLVEQGYNVVMFDFRNSGESGGKLTTVGYLEQDDLISIVRYVNQQESNIPIGVIGFSMGASTSLVAAAKEPLIQAVVADSPFATLREYLNINLPYWSDLPHFPFTYVIMNTLPFITGIDVDQVSPRDAIQNLDTPVFLIHGNGDIAVPYENSLDLHENAKGDIQLWISEGSKHVNSYADDPEEYAQHVIEFFDQHLYGAE